MFKLVSHSNDGGMFIKVKRREEEVQKRFKQFFCVKCQKEFKTKQGLLLHNLKVHPLK
jgi:hypothetical protein